jgi:2-haloacid dehalogenase
VASPARYLFDVYGTLLDVDSAVARCDTGETLPAGFSALWRAKQLEYTWTLQAMGSYREFSSVTRDALDYAIAATGATVASREGLLEAYHHLDAFPEVTDVLRALKASGSHLAVLSNGTAEMLGRALEHAGIGVLLDMTISVDEIGVYKPDPRVYLHAINRLGVPPAQIRFVSANAWDAAGALRCGLRVARVNRSAAPDEYLLSRASAPLDDLRGLLADHSAA